MEENEIVLYTVEDIQKIFSCCKKQTYKIMKIKGFPTMSIDRRLYVEKTALQKWIEKNKGNHFYI